jgi:hypothetical protein
MKIFFMCTHSNQGTGYARVANKITNYLANIPGVEVVYYAFQNYKGQEIKDRFIDPRIKFYDAIELDPVSPRGFGDNGIVPAIIKEKPDVLFLYNDMMVTKSLMELIPEQFMPPVKYVYLDIVYPWQDVGIYDQLKSYNFDQIFVFLECWQKHLVDDLGFSKDVVSVMKHGVDFDRFLDVPQEEAKKRLGFKSDDYLVVNMNRNSYRKCWGVTIVAFLQFLKGQNMNPSIKLFCGCLPLTPDGVDIRKVIHIECAKLKMDAGTVLNNHIFLNPKPLHLTDTEVNNVYNAGDVGLNTGHGEGFGLTTTEHIYFGRPQIVSGVPALKEILGDHAHIVEPKLYMQVTEQEKHGGDLAIVDASEFADYLEYCYTHQDEHPNVRDILKQEYNWENVYKVLDRFFTNGAIPASE